MPHVTRRSFVAGLGASLVPWRIASAAETKVVVVGAGLAGLAATYELQKAGIDVSLIEQSDRAGGRVKTVRGHFADDAWVDVGGQTTGAFYANFFYYSSVFGLEFEAQEEFRKRPDYLMHLQGNLLSGSALRSDPTLWPVDLHAHEKPLAPFRLVSYYLGPIAKAIGKVGDVLKPEFAHYDEMSLRQLMLERGASEAAIQMVNHTANYNSADTVSALSVLRDQVRILHMQGGQALNLDGGNDHLPAAFAKQLADNILYRHSLRAVAQKDDGIELRVANDGLERTIKADHVVIAIPFTALRKIEFAPGLPESRRSIINELPYTQVLQSWIQTKTRFWESDGPVSMLISDGPLERLFNGSRQMKSDRGLLINWINGTGTTAMREGGADAHLERVLSEMRKIWPNADTQIETTLTNDWRDSYVEGAYAHYAPGQLTTHASEIPRPIGNIHFAGEHTELVAPGMEGALTSGKRTAAEILASLTI